MPAPAFIEIVKTINSNLNRDVHYGKKPSGLVAIVPSNVAPPSDDEMQTIYDELRGLAPADIHLLVETQPVPSGVAISVIYE